jgi:hypothetical protein
MTLPHERLVGVAVGEQRDVARLDHRHGRPERDEHRIAMADGDRERHVGRLAGRAGAAVVEVEVAVDVGQARGPRVGRPERGGDARDERAAAAEDDREGPAADERRDAVARAEDLHDPLLAEGRGRELGAAGLSERVDRDADHDDVSPAHVAPRTPPTNSRADSVTLSQ